jgi:hypothetical protein
MSFTSEQAQHAATPPSDPTPGLSLAQDLLERLLCALFGILIVRQIDRILARFVRMRDAWVAGQLQGLPPPPKRTAAIIPRNPRPARRRTPLQTPRIRLAPQPATPTPRLQPARAHPARPIPHARAMPPCLASRPPRALPHPPLRFFALPAPTPNCALIIP